MKASEVFDLPVVSGEEEYDSDGIFQAGGKGQWCATFCSDEQAKVAAHAINHADALADALAVMVQNNWSTAHIRREAQKIAEDALEAYRGAK